MSVASFPPAEGGGGGEVSNYVFELSTGLSKVDFDGIAGIYRIRIWAKDFSASPTGQFSLVNSDGSAVGDASFSDPDSGSTNNIAEAVVRSTGDFELLGVSTSKASWLQIEFLAEYVTGVIVSTTEYTTSQTITFSSPTSGCIIGGGGGGGPRGASLGGGGGGSGFAAFVAITTGSHDLVVGAGGSAGGTGGTTTFLNVSANGGNSTSSRTGGTGGSNGGLGALNVNSSGGNGGSNGSPGDGPLPWFVDGGAGGDGGTDGNPGERGMLYGGGGGGGGTDQYGDWKSGGGGGGVLPGVGGSNGVAGGAGGTGGLIVLNGA